jgi:nitroreductase
VNPIKFIIKFGKQPTPKPGKTGGILMQSINPSRRKAIIATALAAGAAVLPGTALAASSKRKNLPKAHTNGGKPIMEALAGRKSTRQFSSAPVSEQDLSNILWATWGINRQNGMRTAPSARNRQDATIYAALEDGVWEYDAKAQQLVLALPGDQRGKFGGAPLTLLYAATENDEAAAMLLGSLYQNAGLYCASSGLGNVVKITGRDALEGKLPLPSGYRVLVVQSIGWPV